jgi:hypothetical protein
MQCWINGPATDGIDDKIKMAYILIETQYSSVPPFHYSIFGENSKSPKISILSVGCRNSETLILTLCIKDCNHEKP